jgi:hypothetical protein
MLPVPVTKLRAGLRFETTYPLLEDVRLHSDLGILGADVGGGRQHLGDIIFLEKGNTLTKRFFSYK